MLAERISYRETGCNREFQVANHVSISASGKVNINIRGWSDGWSDGKLVRKEAGLRAQSGTLDSISQHSIPHDGQHTPNIAFRHLPPNSARFSYATEGALFISVQLSSDAVSALRKVRVLI